jgi:hypothetical protein
MQGNAMSLFQVFVAAPVILAGLGCCDAQSPDTRPAPEKRQVSSAVRINSTETLLVTLTSSGGGAGDLTYRLLDCRSGEEKCELLASIDTNDNSAPTLSLTQSGIVLTVNKSDYVADFRNFSRKLGTLQPGRLYLHYRPDSGMDS